MKKAIWIAAILIIAAIAFGYQKADGLARIATGYTAKAVCSEVFVADRNQDTVIAGDFENIDPMINRVKVRVDPSAGEVSTSLFGLGRAKAVVREGYGCTLAIDGTPKNPGGWSAVSPQALPRATINDPQFNGRVDQSELNTILANAFEDNGAAHRGLLVLVDGAVVAEAYADGFSVDTRFQSWSMAKSVTATLIGAANLKGLLDLNAAPPVPEWPESDARKKITWVNLLNMQSGLAFEEVYDNPSSDVNRMLFKTRSAGSIAASKRLVGEPDSIWSYSSGTTNLVARSLRQTLEANGGSFHAFAHKNLLEPLGASSVVMETDASGTFIGSSFMYATTRDWAKIGQLYLQDGIWNGARLLPEGWANFVAKPSSRSDGQYGAHFWLNRDGENDRVRFFPELPENVYMMAGHEGQYVIIVPDKKMIIVRTGLTRGADPIKVIGPLIGEIYHSVGMPGQ